MTVDNRFAALIFAFVVTAAGVSARAEGAGSTAPQPATPEGARTTSTRPAAAPLDSYDRDTKSKDTMDRDVK